MEEWTEILYNGGTLDSIYMYMDFMKAFDKVPHKSAGEKEKVNTRYVKRATGE